MLHSDKILSHTVLVRFQNVTNALGYFSIMVCLHWANMSKGQNIINTLENIDAVVIIRVWSEVDIFIQKCTSYNWPRPESWPIFYMHRHYIYWWNSL